MVGVCAGMAGRNPPQLTSLDSADVALHSRARRRAMLILHHNLPASIATKPDVKRVLFSPTDMPEAIKENVFTTVGLHPALKPAVRITSNEPLVPLGSIEGQPDLTDTDSVIKSLDILLMEAGKNKWQHFEPRIATSLSTAQVLTVRSSCSGPCAERTSSIRSTVSSPTRRRWTSPSSHPSSRLRSSSSTMASAATSSNSSRTRPSATCRPAAPTPSTCPSTVRQATA